MIRAGLALVFVSLTAMAAAPTVPANYQADVEQWRKDSEASLKSDNGWLTVAGLSWLKEGENPLGTGHHALIPLPAGPAKAGVIVFRDGLAILRPEPGSGLKVNGREVTEAALKSDANGQTPDEVTLGDRLTFFVIKRGQRYAVRLRDKESKMRREFTRRTWFPVNPQYRVVADWQPYQPHKILQIPNILGEIEEQPGPGKATFTLAGQTYSLEPVLEDGTKIFFIFKDKTSEKETYQPGRFVYGELLPDGKLLLDFNKAYNPPCVFTPFATCPRPPQQNILPVRIPAGELRYVAR